MRCLVTGASGFLGSYVTRSLLGRGAKVGVLLHGEGPDVRLVECIENVHIVRGDIHAPASYREAVLDFAPEIVVHMAWTGVEPGLRNDPLQRDNVDATLALAEIAVQAGARDFLNAGSQAEYGPLNKRISENDATNPTSHYGQAKLAALHKLQDFCAAHRVRLAHVRIFSTYGPMDHPHWLIGYLIAELMAGRKPALTACEQRWDFLYAADAADAFASLAETPQAEGVFNLGSGTAPPLRQTVECIRDLIDCSLPLNIGAVPYRPDQVMHLEADVTRLQRSTRWRPRVTLRDGLQKTVEWYAKRH
jgi:UDP-glucose 4-epimerase